MRRAGFELVPILQESFPRGMLLRRREELRAHAGSLPSGGEAQPGAPLYDAYLGALAQGRGVDGPVRTVRPDLFIVNSVLELNALVLDVRYGIPVVLLSSCLRPTSRVEELEDVEGTVVRLSPATVDAFFSLARRRCPGARRVRDISIRLLGMRHLIQCPQDFELPEDGPPGPELYYIEAGIDLARRSRSASSTESP